MKSYGVNIQIKPFQQYFHVVLFVLYVGLTFELVMNAMALTLNETSSALSLLFAFSILQ